MFSKRKDLGNILFLWRNETAGEGDRVASKGKNWFIKKI